MQDSQIPILPTSWAGWVTFSGALIATLYFILRFLIPLIKGRNGNGITATTISFERVVSSLEQIASSLQSVRDSLLESKVRFEGHEKADDTRFEMINTDNRMTHELLEKLSENIAALTKLTVEYKRKGK